MYTSKEVSVPIKSHEKVKMHLNMIKDCQLK